MKFFLFLLLIPFCLVCADDFFFAEDSLWLEKPFIQGRQSTQIPLSVGKTHANWSTHSHFKYENTELYWNRSHSNHRLPLFTFSSAPGFLWLGERQPRLAFLPPVHKNFKYHMGFEAVFQPMGVSLKTYSDSSFTQVHIQGGMHLSGKTGEIFTGLFWSEHKIYGGQALLKIPSANFEILWEKQTQKFSLATKQVFKQKKFHLTHFFHFNEFAKDSYFHTTLPVKGPRRSRQRIRLQNTFPHGYWQLKLEHEWQNTVLYRSKIHGKLMSQAGDQELGLAFKAEHQDTSALSLGPTYEMNHRSFLGESSALWNTENLFESPTFKLRITSPKRSTTSFAITYYTRPHPEKQTLDFGAKHSLNTNIQQKFTLHFLNSSTMNWHFNSIKWQVLSNF